MYTIQFSNEELYTISCNIENTKCYEIFNVKKNCTNIFTLNNIELGKSVTGLLVTTNCQFTNIL